MGFLARRAAGVRAGAGSVLDDAEGRGLWWSLAHGPGASLALLAPRVPVGDPTRGQGQSAVSNQDPLFPEAHPPTPVANGDTDLPYAVPTT